MPPKLLSVGRMLYSSLLREAKGLPADFRVRSPPDLHMYGRGKQFPTAPSQQERLEMRGFYLGDSETTEIWNDSGDERNTIINLIKHKFRSHATPASKDELDTLLREGFQALQSMKFQAYLSELSATQVTEGLMIDITSVIVENEAREKIAVYSMYLQNISESDTVQVLGRKWNFTSHDGTNSTMEDLNGGIVGQRPTLGPGEAFYYVSGAPCVGESLSIQGHLHVKGGKLGDFFNAKVGPVVVEDI